MAKGNYIEDSDIDNFPISYTDVQKQEVIDRIEELVEKITSDLFYSAVLDIKIDGNGKNRLNLGLKPDILTVTSVEVATIALSTDEWTYDTTDIFLDVTSTSQAELRYLLKEYDETVLFPSGYKNIHVVGTYGWLVCPDNVKKACIILARDDNDATLYDHYIQGQETLGTYTYSQKEKVLTGVYAADKLLRIFVRRKPILGAV